MNRCMLKTYGFLMKINMRLVSCLLIIFSVLGYAVSIQVLYACVTIRTISAWSEDIPIQLASINETVKEVSEDLQKARLLLTNQETLFNTSSELAKSVLLALTNETLNETLVSTNRTLYEIVANLNSISNLTSPAIANEIRAAKNSIWNFTQRFGAFVFFVESTKRNMSGLAGNAVEDLGALRANVKQVQTEIETWSNILNQTSSNIDTWIDRSKILNAYLTSTQYLLYTLAIYLIGLNTSLLLTGIFFYKQYSSRMI